MDLGHTYGYPAANNGIHQAISRDDLEKFWKQNYFQTMRRWWLREHQLATLKPLLKTIWRMEAGEAAPAAMGSPETTDSKLILVDRPGAPRRRWVFSIGLGAIDPGLCAVEVMNTDLAGCSRAAST